MSVARQAIAARRKARKDIRYNRMQSKDAGIRAAKYRAKVEAEKQRKVKR